MRERGSWRRRAARAVWMGTCGLGVLVVAAVVALHSAPARAYLLGRIVAAVNEGIHGTLEADELELRLPNFSVEGLVLRAPGGRVVASAERIDGIPLWPLVRRQLVLDGAYLRKVSISAEVSGEGVDLFAATRKREQPGGKAGGGLKVEGLSLAGGGSIVVRQRGAPGLAETFEAELSSAWVGKDAPGAPTRFALRGPRLQPLGGAFEAGIVLQRKEDGGAIEVSLRNDALTADLSVLPSEPSGARRVEVRRLEVSPEGGAAVLARWPLREALRARGGFSTGGGRAAVQLSGRVGGRVGGGFELHAHSAGDARRAELRLDGVGPGALALPGGDAPVNGTLVVEQRGSKISAHAELERAARGAGTGAVSARLDGDATLLADGTGVRVERLSGRLGELPWRAVSPFTVTRVGSDGGVAVRELVLRARGISVAIAGRASADRVDGTLRASGVDANLVASLLRDWGGLSVPSMRGVLGARLRVSGAPDAPELALEVTGDRLSVAGLPPMELLARGSAPGGPRSDATSRLTARVSARGARATLSASFPGGARELLARARDGGAGALSFSARLSGRLDAAPLAQWSAAERAFGDERLRGVASFTARAHGTLASPSVEGDVRISGLRSRRSPALDGVLRGAWRGGVASLRGRLHARGGGAVEVDATLDRARADASPAADAAPTLHATVEANGFNPAPIAALVPGVEAASGRIDGAATLRGALDDLRATWAVSWVDGVLRTRGYGRFGPFRLQARGDGRAAELAADGGAGGGTFSVRARLSGAGEESRLSGTIETVRLPVVVESELRARVTTRIALSGSAKDYPDVLARVEEGTAELPNASGSLQSMERPEGVVVVGPDGVDGEREPVDPERDAVALAAEEPAPGESPRRTQRPAWRLVVQTARPVEVRRSDLRLRVVTAPSWRVEHRGRLLAYGTLRASSGDVSLSGADIDAFSGTELRFAGPLEPPFVEFAAGRDLGDRALQVQGRRPGGTSHRSDSRVELYSLLSRGRVEPPRSSVHSSVEGRGWGSVLDRALASQVPLGAFLERGASSRAGDIQSSVTGQVDVGSVTRLGGDPSQAENRRTIRLGVRLAPRLRLEGSSGDAGISGVDLMWDVIGEKRVR